MKHINRISKKIYRYTRNKKWNRKIETNDGTDQHEISSGTLSITDMFKANVTISQISNMLKLMNISNGKSWNVKKKGGEVVNFNIKYL